MRPAHRTAQIAPPRRPWQLSAPGALGWLGLCLSACLLCPPRGAPCRGDEAFHFSAGRLTVRTPALELEFHNGAVTRLMNRARGDDLSGRPALSGTPPASAPATAPAAGEARFERLGPGDARLTYPAAKAAVRSGGKSRQLDLERTFDFRVDGGTGEVLVRCRLRSLQPGAAADEVAFPVTGLKGQAVLLGCGAAYRRDEPTARDRCCRYDNGLHSPVIAIVQGRRGCVAVWTDAPIGYGDILLDHGTDHDVLTLHCDRGLSPPGPADTVPDWWRIGAFDSWESAARRYRRHFEAATGAKPLWQAPCAWTRNIHACSTRYSFDPDANAALYQQLARTLDPAKVLLFYWNGDRIVFFGDHRYMTGIGWPKPRAVAELKKLGFRWIGYHPYVLIMPPHMLKERLDMIRRKKWGAPEGYVFQPDYDGPAEGFWEHFRDVSAGYYKPMDRADLWVAHPGSAKVRRYLVRNFGSYCKAHGMDGAYMDILGCDSGYHFPPQRRIVDGLDFRHAEAAAQQDIRKALGDLAVVSEYQTPWIIPYVFYCWEGESHFALPTSYVSIVTRRNHPLRTTLWGSYCWTREAHCDPAQSALIGALPEIDQADEWSVARAKLFTREELFNDLPANWDPAAIACYRGSGGRWFQYRRTDFGEAFVEATLKGPDVRLGRFIGQTASPLAQAVRIQGWPAYKDSRPIGMDPRRVYPFVPGRADADLPVLITDLGALHVSAVREGDGYTVIELGRADGRAAEGKPAEGEVAFTPHRPCLRVCDAQGDKARDLPAGKPVRLKLAGAMVLVWREPSAGDAHKPNAWLKTTGTLNANGLPDTKRPGGGALRMPIELAGQTRSALRVDPGLHRAFAEGWVHLPPGTRPVLKLDLGAEDRPPGRRFAATTFTVQVNGVEIHRHNMPAKAGWHPCGIPLARFAGSADKVLVTLSMSADATGDLPVGMGMPNFYIAGAHIEDTPAR